MLYHLARFFLLISIAKLALCINSLCSQPPVRQVDQDCRARIPTLFYDRDSDSCKCFYYKGCGGTENRFNSLSECMINCNVGPDKQIDRTPCETLKGASSTPNKPSTFGAAASSVAKPDVSNISPHPCEQPLSQGECLDYIPSFFYNKKSAMCDCFIYSGCKGNENRFKTMRECMSTCRVNPNNQIVSDTCKRDFEGTNILLQLLNDKTLNKNPKPNHKSTCEQPQKPGSCRAFIPSFFFNQKTGICDCFIYTGCQGNENRFKSLYDCISACGVSLKSQEVTQACKDHFKGSQVLLDLLNDQRLRGNDVQSAADQPSSGSFDFFPALPRLPRPIRDLPKRISGLLHSGSSSQPKSMSVGDPVAASFFESPSHSWQNKK